MDLKRFKKTYKYICNGCGEFMHTKTDYCEKCGSSDMRKANKEDYSKYAAGEKAEQKAEKAEKKAEERAEKAERKAEEKTAKEAEGT